MVDTAEYTPGDAESSGPPHRSGTEGILDKVTALFRLDSRERPHLAKKETQSLCDQYFSVKLLRPAPVSLSDDGREGLEEVRRSFLKKRWVVMLSVVKRRPIVTGGPCQEPQ